MLATDLVKKVSEYIGSPLASYLRQISHYRQPSRTRETFDPQSPTDDFVYNQIGYEQKEAPFKREDEQVEETHCHFNRECIHVRDDSEVNIKQMVANT